MAATACRLQPARQDRRETAQESAFAEHQANSHADPAYAMLFNGCGGQFPVAAQRLHESDLLRHAIAFVVDLVAAAGVITDRRRADETGQRRGSCRYQFFRAYYAGVGNRLFPRGGPAPVADVLAHQVDDAVRAIDRGVRNGLVAVIPGERRYPEFGRSALAIAAQRHNFVTCPLQSSAEPAANEAGRAGDQNFHFASPADRSVRNYIRAAPGAGFRTAPGVFLRPPLSCRLWASAGARNRRTRAPS